MGQNIDLKSKFKKSLKKLTNSLKKRSINLKKSLKKTKSLKKVKSLSDDDKKDYLQRLTSPDVDKDEKLKIRDILSNESSIKQEFCSNLNYDDCTDSNSFCYYGEKYTQIDLEGKPPTKEYLENYGLEKSGDKKCNYDLKNEEQFFESISNECLNGCQCLLEKPYEYSYRGRKYCTNKLKFDSFNEAFFNRPKAYKFTEISAIRKEIKKYGLLKAIKKNLANFGIAAGLALGQQLVSRILVVLCRIYLDSWHGNYQTVFVRDVFMDKDGEMMGFNGIWLNNKSLSDNIKLISKEYFSAFKKDLNFDVKRIPEGFLSGYMGAQEEYIFRETLSDYTQMLKPKIFELMNKFNLSDKITIENVKLVYTMIDVIFTGLLFGLAHLTNLQIDNGQHINFEDKQFINSVICQVCFTAITSWIWYFLAKYRNLQTAWLQHFFHNFYQRTLKYGIPIIKLKIN